jgi:hypothetical protein
VKQEKRRRKAEQREKKKAAQKDKKKYEQEVFLPIFCLSKYLHLLVHACSIYFRLAP